MVSLATDRVYMTGYNGTARTRDEFLKWSHIQDLDPEMRDSVLWIVDYSILIGFPLGVGSVSRTAEHANSVALSRHYQVASGGCCSFEGKRYQLRSGQAHAAFSGATYHEKMTRPVPKALAVDFTGNLKVLKEHGPKVNLTEFSGVNNEPWHSQRKEIPQARRRYVYGNKAYDPLPNIILPPLPGEAQKVVIIAPDHVLMQPRPGSTHVNDVAEVRDFQHQCNFWRFLDAMGRTLIVDGDFGAKTTQACISMQRELNKWLVMKGQAPLKVDGIYGAYTHWWFQVFLNEVTG